ncbi:ABC transporter ATP-binding protein [Clostridium botulinum]|uniref:ABC transporter ATP-binding protein n=1 Tax=Clostridium botulinum TaxID=1491 RepID=UPI000773B6F3|nr:ABC transporter ATP-binding protein [Clostridium botulinum]AUN01968.1 ABC transporter permease [Clostridium botulinum]MBN3398733.1 ABC transporter ATP-binding protein [Clostridium botulinum]MBN3413577.1 ABC transporter ATP-binding protein [Clostridium botulinum]
MRTTLRIFIGARRYWIHLILALIAVIISTIAGFYNPWALRELTSIATEGSANFGGQSLRIGLMLLVATILQSAGSAISGYLNHHAALHYVADMRTELYFKLQHMGLRYFNKSRTGDLTSRVINDVMEVEILLAHIIPDFVVNILTFIGVGILLFSINVKLAFISLVTIPFIIMITLWQSKHLSPIWKQNSMIRGELSGTVQDNFSGIKEIQIFNQQEREEKRIKNLSMKHSKAYLKASFFFETTFPLLTFFTALGSVIAIIFGGFMVSRGEINIGDIVGFSMYLGMFYGPIKSFSRLMEMAGNAVAGCKRVFEVMDEVPDVKEKVNANKLPRVKGEVEFKGISFAYNDEIKILKNINLKVNPGETVAFVGATGVGKSTIASLLNRFYDPQNGSILMDGIDIKDVTLKSLRDNISMVLQDTFLFNGTIYENIVYGWKEATKDQVVAASKAANAHNFIENLEDGYDTIIGERGVRLSGGQKQRISIARAILRNSPILILDEATSALDTKTEKEIQAALDEISKDRTTIVIAHRLSTIYNADKIVVLEGAGIKEMGTHDELIRSGGTYAMLYKSQVS